MVGDNEIGHVLNAADEPIRSVHDLAGKAFSAGARDNVSNDRCRKLDYPDAMTEAAGNTRRQKLFSGHKWNMGCSMGRQAAESGKH